MLGKYLFAPAILASAGLLMSGDAVIARGQGGHGGGGHAGGGHAGAVHATAHASAGHTAVARGGVARGGGARGGYGRGGAGYGRGGYGRGYGGYGYGGFGGLYGWYGPGWYGGYGWPYYDSGYYSPDPLYYGDAGPAGVPAPSVVQTPAPPVDNDAHIHVILPDPQARVWFDDMATQETGTDRWFETPALSPGGTYRYHIRASWVQDGQEVNQERTVAVGPGQMSVVDFTH